MQNSKILEKTENGVKESYKILIQELVLDLEKRGVFPVWSSDGKIKKLKVIHDSELVDFKNINFTKFDHEENDFCLLEEDKTDHKSIFPFFTPSGKVIIINKKNGKTKEYKAGNASHWVYDFETDLKNKSFE